MGTRCPHNSYLYIQSMTYKDLMARLTMLEREVALLRHRMEKN